VDAVEQDLRTLGIRGWKNIALDGSRWRGIAKGGQGLKRAVTPQKKKTKKKKDEKEKKKSMLRVLLVL
jgi:hypothetical protein